MDFNMTIRIITSDKKGKVVRRRTKVSTKSISDAALIFESLVMNLSNIDIIQRSQNYRGPLPNNDGTVSAANVPIVN